MMKKGFDVDVAFSKGPGEHCIFLNPHFKAEKTPELPSGCCQVRLILEAMSSPFILEIGREGIENMGIGKPRAELENFK